MFCPIQERLGPLIVFRELINARHYRCQGYQEVAGVLRIVKRYGGFRGMPGGYLEGFFGFLQ